MMLGNCCPGEAGARGAGLKAEVRQGARADVVLRLVRSAPGAGLSEMTRGISCMGITHGSHLPQTQTLRPNSCRPLCPLSHTSQAQPVQKCIQHLVP